jgi:hypothetical protein
MTTDDARAAEYEAISKLLGVREHAAGVGCFPVTRGDRRTIADDALALLGGTVADLGGAVSATVRVLLVSFARRSAVAGFYDCMADEHGLSSEAGIAFASLAIKHASAAQRALKQALAAHAVLSGTAKHDAIEAFRARINGAAPPLTKDGSP